MESLVSFVVALLATFLCIPLSAYQRRKLLEQVGPARPGENESVGINSHPSRSETYVSQSLEFAYGFPSIVLTAVAYLVAFSPPGLLLAVLFIPAVGLILLLIYLMDPQNVERYQVLTFRGISVVTYIVLIANLVGVVLVLFGLGADAEV